MEGFYSMGVFHVFKIVQMVPNRAKHISMYVCISLYMYVYMYNIYIVYNMYIFNIYIVIASLRRAPLVDISPCEIF